MTQAYYTGLSGLKNSSYGIDIVSDNLANVNTIGYRGNNYEFSSLFEESIATANRQESNTIGLGVSIQATPMTQTQGSYRVTDNSTDLAILGDGWFGVQGENEPLYTRNGAFTFNENSDLVTNEGYYVLGTKAGNIDGETLTEAIDSVDLGDVNAQEQLRFPKTLNYPATPTTLASFQGNIGTTPELRAMSATVVDSNGTRNELRLEYTMSDPQPEIGTQRDVTATTRDINDVKKVYDTQTGVVSFDETGALISSSLTTIDNNGTPVTIDLGSSYSGVVAIANVPITSSSVTDGTIGGELRGYDINKNGEVIATFTNGKQSSVGRIAVYHFQNNQGLNRVSGTNFAVSPNSGNAVFYQDVNGNNVLGTDITNFQLENSNVDMTTGLTELIILQRTYDANSKSITTADEMIQKALNMDG